MSKAKYSDALILLVNLQRSEKVHIPIEILCEIFFEWIDYYWPVSEEATNDHVSAGNNANRLYVSIPVDIQHAIFIPNKISFEISSRDQGWSDFHHEHGTRSSFTWGEAALSITPDDRYEVYRNIHAGSSFELQTACFDSNHALVQALQSHFQPGETNIIANPVTVDLYVRSQYPSWVNNIHMAKIQVEWKPRRLAIPVCVQDIIEPPEGKVRPIYNNVSTKSNPKNCVIM